MRKQEIKDIFEFCLLANSSEETILQHFPQAEIFGSSVIRDFGFIVETEDKIYVAFRGSDDKEDWKSNFKMKINDKGYHSGFYKAALHLSGFILATLEEILKDKNKPIIFTGHSRGGALALLCGNDIYNTLSRNNSISVEIFTYGCPKVASKNSSLIKNIQSGKIKHTSVINGCDIVPRVPFEFPWSKDYTTEGDYFSIGDEVTNLEKVKMLFYLLTRRKGKEIKWFKDHNQRKYKVKLEEWQTK